MSQLVASSRAAAACHRPVAGRHGLLSGSPVTALPRPFLRAQRPSSSSWPHHVACSSLRQQPEPLEAAPPLKAVPGSQPAQQQPQPQQQQEHWMPASLLSGWKGMGTLMLSLGAVTGGGLLGAHVQAAAAAYARRTPS